MHISFNFELAVESAINESCQGLQKRTDWFIYPWWSSPNHSSSTYVEIARHGSVQLSLSLVDFISTKWLLDFHLTIRAVLLTLAYIYLCIGYFCENIYAPHTPTESPKLLSLMCSIYNIISQNPLTTTVQHCNSNQPIRTIYSERISFGKSPLQLGWQVAAHILPISGLQCENIYKKVKITQPPVRLVGMWGLLFRIRKDGEKTYLLVLLRKKQYAQRHD